MSFRVKKNCNKKKKQQKTETHLSCGVKNQNTALLEEKFDQPSSINIQNNLFT